MSGMRRRTKYRKNVQNDYLNEYPVPDFSQGEKLARMLKSHGSNIIEIEVLPGQTNREITTDQNETSDEKGTLEKVNQQSSLENVEVALKKEKTTALDSSAASTPSVAAKLTNSKTTITNTPPKTSGLCRIPTKFRRLIWVRKGSYLIVNGSESDYETAKGVKGRVIYEVKHVLNEDQIQHIKDEGLWPQQQHNKGDGKIDGQDTETDTSSKETGSSSSSCLAEAAQQNNLLSKDGTGPSSIGNTQKQQSSNGTGIVTMDALFTNRNKSNHLSYESDESGSSSDDGEDTDDESTDSD
eukprot:g1301.t1